MKDNSNLIVYGIIYLIVIIGTLCIIGEEHKADDIQKIQCVKGEN